MNISKYMKILNIKTESHKARARIAQPFSGEALCCGKSRKISAGVDVSHKNKGFTLIEILIYISMLVIVSVFVINTILIMARSFSSIKTTRIINASSEIAMERMIREIRLADSIDTDLSDFDSHPGRLTLNTIDPFTETSTTIEFSLSGNTLQIQKGFAPAIPLTSYDVRVNNLIFKRIVNSTVSEAVKIEIELESGERNDIKSSKFYSTAVLRRSY